MTKQVTDALYSCVTPLNNRERLSKPWHKVFPIVLYFTQSTMLHARSRSWAKALMASQRDFWEQKDRLEEELLAAVVSRLINH